MCRGACLDEGRRSISQDGYPRRMKGGEFNAIQEQQWNPSCYQRLVVVWIAVAMYCGVLRQVKEYK